MSKTLTKILTICGLCVMIVAAVIASAICATAAIGYYVSVDVVKTMNEDFNSPLGDVKIKINGEETEKLLVKKGTEAVVTFEIKDFQFQGFFEGNNVMYDSLAPIIDENGTLVESYKFVVDSETELTAVFKADVFYKFTVKHNTDSAIDAERVIGIGAQGDHCYNDADTVGLYWAKRGSQISLVHQEVGFRFNNWYEGTVDQGVTRDEVVTVDENNKLYTADFSKINKYTVTIAPSYDTEAIGGQLQASAVGGAISYEAYEGTKINLMCSATGYEFVNWTSNGTEVGTTAVIEYEITENAEVKANFNAIRYNISYDGAEAVSTVWGSALSSPASTYDANTGWKVFTGWKLNGETVTQAKFAGTDRNITLTGEYLNQNNITYVFAVGDKTITYKTVGGDRLDLTNAPSKNYYDLTGIKLDIDGTNYEFAISGNNLVSVEGGKTLQEFDQALINSGLNQFAITPVYQLAFKLKLVAGTDGTADENPLSGSDGISQTFNAGTDEATISSFSIWNYFKGSRDFSGVRKITVKRTVAGNDIVAQRGVDIQTMTIEDVLGVNGLQVPANNTADIEITITFLNY